MVLNSSAHDFKLYENKVLYHMILKISIAGDVSLIYQVSFLLEGERVVQFDGHRWERPLAFCGAFWLSQSPAKSASI